MTIELHSLNPAVKELFDELRVDRSPPHQGAHVLAAVQARLAAGPVEPTVPETRRRPASTYKLGPVKGLALAALCMFGPDPTASVPPAAVDAPVAEAPAAVPALTVPAPTAPIREDNSAAPPAEPIDAPPTASTTERTPPRAEPEPPATRGKVRPRRASLPPPEVSEDPLAAELRLVERARLSLSRGQLARAKRTLARLRQEFPDGAFMDERAAVEILVACASAEPSAVARADSFLAEVRRSPYRSQIHAQCIAPKKAATRDGE